jgi:hypothetical protein
MITDDQYPMVLTCEGARSRPRHVALLRNDCWRVDWMDGLVTLYGRDPREHLRLGYDPKHLRRRA